MSTKKCKVDVVSVAVKQFDDVELKLNFLDILKHPEIVNREKHINNRLVHYSIIKENENYIVGFLRTTLDKDLPAKIDKSTKTISKLDVKDNEGLAYGSIFLYSIELKILFFEVNKNSIYLNSFRDFIYKCHNSSPTLMNSTSFDIQFGTIYRKKEYERALKMSYFKSFKVKVHQPAKLLREINELNRTLEEQIQIDFFPQLEQAAELNSEIAEIEFKAPRKKESGLYKDKIVPIIESFKNLTGYGQIRENLDTIEICGYTEDNSKAKKPIDLLGDVYFTSFKLDIPRLDSNLQQKDRKESIEKIYADEYSYLKDYI